MNVSASIPTPPPAAVEFRAVTKRYDDTVALDGVSFDIPIGQTFAIIGPNGAGKSTAISLMLGLLDPTAGSVRTLGLDPRVAVANGRVGALLQTSGLPVTARVDELVAFVRRLYPEPLPLATVLRGRAYASWNGDRSRRSPAARVSASDLRWRGNRR